MNASPARFTRCPRCAHAPLPQDQSLPAACPGCGVILAKVGQQPVRRAEAVPRIDDQTGPGAHWLHVPDRVDAWTWRARAAMWIAFAAWTVRLAGLDLRSGEIMQSFLHLPLLVFHEAGHVVFRLAGEWVSVLGGALGQSLMPLIMAAALLWKNRDPYGAALAMWLFGVSLLDTAAYVADAQAPQLILMGGHTGNEGFHDWIYLLDTGGVLHHALRIGLFVHAGGVVAMLASLGWGALVLWLQRARIAPPT